MPPSQLAESEGQALRSRTTKAVELPHGAGAHTRRVGRFVRCGDGPAESDFADSKTFAFVFDKAGVPVATFFSTDKKPRWFDLKLWLHNLKFLT